MLIDLIQLAVVAWLPGAVIFRLPIADRPQRAALDAEERVFWAVVIGLSISLSVVLALAAAGQYTFQRLLLIDAFVAVGAASAARFRLSLGPTARRAGISALIPIALVALGCWRFFPASEYVMGGKDPGVYMNEGIQIAQRGTFVYDDPIVASVPPPMRDLFFPSHGVEEYYGLRFMGFFVTDPDRGSVVGQFPHLFPASIAIGYGIDGLSGARRTVGVWGILGLLALYFAGAQLAGRIVAGSAASLLALHVIQVWFARYPNAELVMQALLFAALLAFARAHDDRDRFFSPIAGMLLGLLLFLRIDAVLAIAAIAAAISLLVATGHRWHPGLVSVLAGFTALAVIYMTGPMRAYAHRPITFVTGLHAWQQLAILTAVAGMIAIVVIGSRKPAVSRWLTPLAPAALAVALVAAAIYALYFREQAGKLAIYDAHALRSFTNFYFSLPALFAALAGFVLLARRRFWRSPALFITIAVFSFFFFYKIRIVPEHFWAARRFLPVILPGALLFACAAAGWGLQQRGSRRLVSGLIGAVFISLIGAHYARAARPILGHVEYAGIISQLEQLAGQIKDDELLIVESRDAGSDAHVMALPLAYIYARNVLVFVSPRPDSAVFGPFLEWARDRYRRVYFLGGGGTELLSRQWDATSVSSQRFQVPEWDSALEAYPRGARRKEFEFGLYELLPPDGTAPAESFDLDVGIHDDLHVVRFHAKEETAGHSFRWSQRQSFVSIPGVPAGSREVVIVMSSGGRPEGAPPAEVAVYFNDRLLGTTRVADGFAPYTFDLPADVARAASDGELARLRLVTSVWNPNQTLGSADDRELGVMVDRVQVR